jgi:hypothetical protein
VRRRTRVMGGVRPTKLLHTAGIMSWYNTVVLSFGCDEFEDEEDESNHDCAALRKINGWLRQRHFEPLSDLNSARTGKLGSTPFSLAVATTTWMSMASSNSLDNKTGSVQVLFWDDNASKCTLIGVGGAARKRRKSATNRRLHRRTTTTRRGT